MKPVIAIVGRANVGKSTIYNVLTNTQDALVYDTPGVTRDRLLGEGKFANHQFFVIDTGGLGHEVLEDDLSDQVFKACDEADLILFVTDGRAGLMQYDQVVAERLRRMNKPVVLAVNKCENRGDLASEFYELGFAVFPISASHRQGIRELQEALVEHIPVIDDIPATKRMRLCFMGRPNVGKSTLMNRLLGDDRVIVKDMPGTTRDPISADFDHDLGEFQLVDTAGIRKQGKVDDRLEQLTVLKALRTMIAVDVAVMVVDAREGLTDQDRTLMGLAIKHGKALVVVLNKWDGMDPYDRDQIKERVSQTLRFIPYVEIFSISALHGSGVGDILPAVKRAYDSASIDISASKLTKLLEEFVKSYAPPAYQGRRIKLRYAHQAGFRPPKILIHGNQTDKLPDSYIKYLENNYRKALGLVGTPIVIKTQTSDNPYKGTRVFTRKDRLRAKRVRERDKRK